MGKERSRKGSREIVLKMVGEWWGSDIFFKY